MAADPATLTRTVRWLVAQALYWGRAWSAALGRPLSVSIPLVGDRLADVGGAACDAVLATLRAHAPAPRGALDLLVAEATLLRDGPPLKAALKTLRGAGVSVTMTDFGARTISLPLLKGVVPERLKLHRLFVRDVMRDPERQALARSLIALAQTMSITSIADGIASDGDAQFFRWEGCELGQGDALGPACTPENLAASAPPQSRLT